MASGGADDQSPFDVCAGREDDAHTVTDTRINLDPCNSNLLGILELRVEQLRTILQFLEVIHLLHESKGRVT